MILQKQLKSWKRSFGLAVLASFTVFNIAAAEGEVYLESQTPEPSRKTITIYRVNSDKDNAAIWEMKYDRVNQQGNKEQIITATGYYDDGFVVLTGTKHDKGNYSEASFPHARYPFYKYTAYEIWVNDTGHFPGANEFLNYSVPGIYELTTAMPPPASPYAAIRLLEVVGSASEAYYHSNIDSAYKSSCYIEHSYVPMLDMDYPAIPHPVPGYSLDLYLNMEDGTRRHVAEYIVDAQLENIWIRDNDKHITHIYSLHAVG